MGILLCFKAMDSAKRELVLSHMERFDEQQVLQWGLGFLEDVEHQVHSVAARYVRSIEQLERELGVVIETDRVAIVAEGHSSTVGHSNTLDSQLRDDNLHTLDFALSQNNGVPVGDDYTLEEILSGYTLPVDFFIEDPLIPAFFNT